MVNPLLIFDEAIQLALMGKGYTGTNPVVGAIVVKNGKIIGRGYHKAFGMPHAEIEALKDCEESPEGADLYVTLEPCSTYGKTPPCTEAIIKSGIKRVFIGVVDPNPDHSGKAVDILKESGVEVFIGYNEKVCAEIIEDFTKFILLKKPYFILKAATTLDGKLATVTGDSKWITNESSRIYVQYLRTISDAILVGINTVHKDDPMLNVRSFGRDKEPIKIVVDSHLSIDENSKLVKEFGRHLLIATTNRDEIKISKLQKYGVKILLCANKDGRVDLSDLSDKLINMNLLNILVEGGSRIFGSFLKNGLADKLYHFIAPKVIGGDGISMFDTLGIENIEGAISCSLLYTKRFEEDILNVYKFYDYTKHTLELTEKVRNRCKHKCSQE
ncbi:MAG: bifunctional diaminohydroxyphosphoribosylaminopyrimidine deaminase/5-amino-6-(5-phosphoribosylamino)uracil reductase RibD [Calditerrivibrio sp.]|nr:bifunctional diaminohydroxyphosphoribosylaminopyrimidine deaminase/5-amino-6-(5-phosphoribosylamino)uracil reductase RibD [Calditerrivibrio sp.]